MNLYIINKGDRSTGLYATEYTISCPFEKNDVEQNDLNYFKQLQINIFNEFLDIKFYALYDYEFIED